MTEPLEHLNTQGLVTAGEIESRAFRETRSAEDYRNAEIAGAVKAYAETSLWCQALIARAGPYDDTRFLQHQLIWLADQIREVQTGG